MFGGLFRLPRGTLSQTQIANVFCVNQTQGEAGLVRRGGRLMHFTAGFNLQLTPGVKSGHQVVCLQYFSHWLFHTKD